ncbi:hypothetical protein [Lentibacillus sediminis]|uniref:hypothetical protein n=1 Tax=Lentibacillus sediminis TaxID=1940529 RepID=UPI000C1B9126|nr:hypothetical protein [Lentibacillus sediminis]
MKKRITKIKRNKDIARVILLVVLISLIPLLHNNFHTLTILVVALGIYALVLFVVGRLSEEEKK